MDTFTKASLIWLSIQLGIMGYTISRLAYDLGYERGKAAVYQLFAEDGTEGAKYTGDTNDQNKKNLRAGKRN